LPALVRYLRDEHPRVVISALNYVNVVTLWARSLSRVDVPVIVSEHNTPSVLRLVSHKRRARLMPRLTRHFYRWADRIVAVSEGVAQDLTRSLGIDPERIEVIYNPVITPELRERARAAVDHPWLVAGAPPLIVAVGRMAAQKDYPLLLRAFEQVRRKRAARLMILGDGPLRDRLQAQAKEMGISDAVSMPGFVDNPLAFVSRASLFALSSRCEGLPTVLIEALYCGTPIVSTDCPSGPREILKAGRYGRLVPVGDADALSAAMENALRERPPAPPEESWKPYTVDHAVDGFCRLLSDFV
jgi:glycosyltransferase involved in cell wall biosynthesis